MLRNPVQAAWSNQETWLIPSIRAALSRLPARSTAFMTSVLLTPCVEFEYYSVELALLEVFQAIASEFE